MAGVETLMGLPDPPTAIFCYNDMTALGALRQLHLRKIRVPEDVSLVGFDDLLASAYTTPPLTTVRQPIFDIGSAAAQAILDLIEQRPARLPDFATELIIRESAVLRR